MSEDLQRLAKQAAAKAYAPYSNFQVGAALRTTDGRIFSGCNIENVSYPEGWCAETTAISHMVMDGGGEIAEVAVVGLQLSGITPCGGCRQRLAEFGKPDTQVHLCNLEGVIKTHTLNEILPNAFNMDGAE